MKKVYLIVLVIIVLATAAGYYMVREGDLPDSESKLESREFSGEVLSLDGNKVLINGSFIVADRPDLLAANYLREATVLVDENTKITRTVRFPTPPKEPSNGPTFMKDKRSEESVVDFQTFSANATQYNVYIQAFSDSNIYDSREFRAVEVRYEFRLTESFDEIE